VTEATEVKALPAASTGAKDPFLEMIEKVSATPNVNVDTLDRLLQMQERIMMKNAEAEFNNAMRECQSEMKAILANEENPQTRSKYASYERLDRDLRPLYTKHGFAISFNTAPLDGREAVRVLAYVSRGVFTRQYQVDVPADGKGAKGGDVMTKTHAVGSAMSYGSRYLLKFIFNVAISEEDDDGNRAGGKKEPEVDEAGKKLLEACGSMASLEDCWANKLTKDQRRTLIKVRDECKARIKEADKVAS
jgi:hypothetical protein